jgi:hypothetical protein
MQSPHSQTVTQHCSTIPAAVTPNCQQPLLLPQHQLHFKALLHTRCCPLLLQLLQKHFLQVPNSTANWTRQERPVYTGRSDLPRQQLLQPLLLRRYLCFTLPFRTLRLLPGSAVRTPTSRRCCRW